MSRRHSFPIPSFVVLSLLGAAIIFAIFSSPGRSSSRHPAVDYFGAEVATLRPTEARALGVSEQTAGVIVDGIVAGCLASQSGLAPDDIIIGVNGQPVQDDHQFWTRLARGSGPVVALDVVRRGAPQQITVPWQQGQGTGNGTLAAAQQNPCAVCPL